jgi:hypothetical protein
MSRYTRYTFRVPVPFADMTGYTSDSHLCIDCGFNTAPGYPTRAELEAKYVGIGRPAEVPAYIDSNSEVFMLHKEVWAETGVAGYGGCLCIGCVEKRIGRHLNVRDFLWGHAFNFPGMPGTARLLKRRRGKPVW